MVTFKALTDQAGQSAVGWFVVGVLGGLFWLIRRVFTNQKQIELLQVTLESREKERARDRAEYKADIAEIKASQHDLAQDIKNLFQR